LSDADVDFATVLGDYLAMLAQRGGAPGEAQQVVAVERRRIAQELHDGLAQELTGVVLTLEGCHRAVQRGAAVPAGDLAKASRDARAVLADVRQYLAALRQESGAASLPVTIARIVDDVRRSSTVRVELEELGQERALPHAIERAVARIAQEALHNVTQHAQATEARVVLQYEDNSVALTVEDNGRGFAIDETLATADQRGRFGLLGMRERAESVGGTLQLRSRTGQGTLVQARVPYDSTPRLNVVPAWSGQARADVGEEVAPQVIEEDVEEMGERRGLLSRLFGQR
jgi:signal transduction histidine kinase